MDDRSTGAVGQPGSGAGIIDVDEEVQLRLPQSDMRDGTPLSLVAENAGLTPPVFRSGLSSGYGAVQRGDILRSRRLSDDTAWMKESVLGAGGSAFPLNEQDQLKLTPQTVRAGPLFASGSNLNAGGIEQHNTNSTSRAVVGSSTDVQNKMQRNFEDNLQSNVIFKQQKPLMLPDRYTGEVPWMDYVAHFNSCAQINGWNEVQKGDYLAASLHGAAQEVIGDLPYHLTVSYSDLVRHLERRFGVGGQAELHLTELRNRVRKDKESLPELEQVIRRLASLAYPGVPVDVIDRLARGHFVDALPDPDMRFKIFQMKPATLNDAVMVSLELESFLKSERGMLRTSYVRSLYDQSNDEPVFEFW